MIKANGITSKDGYQLQMINGNNIIMVTLTTGVSLVYKWGQICMHLVRNQQINVII